MGCGGFIAFAAFIVLFGFGVLAFSTLTFVCWHLDEHPFLYDRSYCLQLVFHRYHQLYKGVSYIFLWARTPVQAQKGGGALLQAPKSDIFVIIA